MGIGHASASCCSRKDVKLKDRELTENTPQYRKIHQNTNKQGQSCHLTCIEVAGSSDTLEIYLAADI